MDAAHPAASDADTRLIETAIDWVEGGQRALLATVARTWGASPRPPGSMMLIREDGHYLGSVSGGCVENDLIERITRGELADAFPTRVDYGVDREQAGRLGLPCGGRLELVVEALDSVAPLRALRDSLRAGRVMVRHLCLSTGEVSLHPADDDAAFSYDEDAMKRPFGPAWQLLLIGAGQLAAAVARLALMLGYRVMLCDPRDSGVYSESIEGVQLLREMPDDAVRAYAAHPRSAVIALSHDPRIDDLALLEALESDAFYIGALGSRVNSDKRRIRLKSMGLTDKQLARLHAPVGLSIGSRTPAEIAISIVAELTAVRNARQTRQTNHGMGAA